jgi:hypothetical protein
MSDPQVNGYDNPAARLHEILFRALAHPNDAAAFSVWADVLEATKDSSTVLARLSKVMLLPAEITILLREHYPKLASASDIWRSPLESAFISQRLDGQWITFKGKIDANCMSQLEMLSEMLHAKLHTVMSSEEDISNVLEMFDALLNSLQEQSDIPADLRIYLYREIAILKRKLVEYKITGLSEVIRQSEAIVGHAARDASHWKFLTDHALGQRLLDSLNAAAALVTIHGGLPALSAATPFVLQLTMGQSG